MYRKVKLSNPITEDALARMSMVSKTIEVTSLNESFISFTFLYNLIAPNRPYLVLLRI